MRKLMVLTPLMVIALSGGAAAALRAPTKLADLIVTEVSNPPASFTGTLTVSYTVANAGKAQAEVTKTSFYLSSTRAVGGSSVLIGRQRVAGLRAGKRKSEMVVLTPAGVASGSYYLVACAGSTNGTKPGGRKGRCRASSKPGSFRPSAATSTTSGQSPPSSGTGSSPQPPPQCAVTDASCQTNAIFVSAMYPASDLNPGTRALPKASLANAIDTANHFHENVYATVGAYYEELDVDNGVSVYGGYDSSWQPAPSGATTIYGANDYGLGSVGAVATYITSPTVIRDLTISPPYTFTANGFPTGATSYGLWGFDDPGLRLQDVTIQAAPGGAGAAGQNGLTGENGGTGSSGSANGYYGGAGGSSPVGRPGGNGGLGGLGEDNFETGQTGFQGQPTTPDQWGELGGTGGAGGAGGSSYKAGANGWPGDDGKFLGNGSGGGSGNGAGIGTNMWLSEAGTPGLNGTDGAGGGGGGGGGTVAGHTDYGLNTAAGGGGGGGGAQGGGGGAGGQGGGGSFGIFIIPAVGSPDPLVEDCKVTAADGGTGGQGGAGAFGGTGGSGGFTGTAAQNGAEGGAGGRGGNGGGGGGGAGGAGGPSIAIYGLTASDTPGTTLSFGQGGAGGAGGTPAVLIGPQTPAGATGQAADYMPATPN